MAATQVFVDRFHFPNHIDNWCKKHMNPNKVSELTGVNTEVRMTLTT
jgi:macrodomain Ter protein organizer (MatP/YcbG family)